MIVKYRLNADGTNPIIPSYAKLDNGHFKNKDWYLGYLTGKDLDKALLLCAKNEMTELSDAEALVYTTEVMPKDTIIWDLNIKAQEQRKTVTDMQIVDGKIKPTVSAVAIGD